MATRGLFLIALAAVLLSGCLSRREGDTTGNVNNCVQCHGSVTNPGDALTQSAPPTDISGNSGTEFPGVGAHALHLTASASHAAFACAECHVVPETVEDKGHADTALPAELTFGTLATHKAYSPRYDVKARSCSDTYCHLSATPQWRAPRTPDQACGTCHGLPPAPPHVQGTQCSECHGQVVNERGEIIAAALHVDGKVQVQQAACNSCHGDPSGSGESSDVLNAPPVDTNGKKNPSERGVGAHQVHLSGTGNSRPLACAECHRVPKRFDDAGHLNGLPADVLLGGVAETGATTPEYDASTATCGGTWCHSPAPADAALVHTTSPVWTSNTPLACDGCHSMPPPAPHPAVAECGFCHAEVFAEDHRTPLAPERHVDGVVDVAVPEDCNECHGSPENAAPPRDLDGLMELTSAGVGAHQAHLIGSGNSRPLACEECHQVPSQTNSSGHLDTARPAEVTFQGVALSFTADPHYEFDTHRCVDAYCHGANYVGRNLGGTDTAPDWTSGMGEPLACDSCHALPPPAPHPADAQCANCHKNVDASGTILFPDLHVDGDVTFAVP